MLLSVQPPVIAHRGASLYAPENTLSAFRQAKAMGVNWVELDVMLSADHELVVIHDDTLDRTSTGAGRVASYSLDFLKTLDVGNWFSSSYKNERIPTLKETLALLTALKMHANIEIKSQTGNEELTVLKVREALALYPDFSGIISSFSLPILRNVKRILKNYPLGFLMHEWQDDWQMRIDELMAFSVHVNHCILSAKRVKEIKSSNRLLLTYTVNTQKRAQTLFSWGVDAVFTDDPQLILGKAAI